MPDVLLVLTGALACGGLGLPLARLLPARAFAWRALAAPVLGLAVLGVLATAGYGAGLPPAGTLAVALLGAGVGLALEVRWRRRAGPGAWRGPAQALGGWAVLLALLLAPRFTGGDRFALFQGNHWDTFGYLGSALVYAREPQAALAAAGQEALLRHPLWIEARRNLAERPGVMLAYAALSRVDPPETWRLHYAFLAFLLSLTALAAALLLRRWLPGARPWAAALAAPAFALGFWGQYALDINAWSQLAAAPGLLLLAGLLVEAAAGEEAAPGERARLAGAIAVLTAGAAFLYPEGLTYHLAVLAPLAGAALGWAAWRARRLDPGPFLPLLGLAGVAASLLAWDATFGFMLRQAALARGEPVTWWRFFQAFLSGRDGWTPGEPLLASAVDLGAGLLGLFFATPPPGEAPALALAWRLALGALCLALPAAAALALWRRGAPVPGAGPAAAPEPDLRRLRLASLALAGLLAPVALFAARGHYWEAGKAVSWASPLLLLLLAAPALAPGPGRWRQAAGAVAAAFVAFQLGLGLLRVGAAAGPDGIHYEPPYPAVQDEQLKRQLRLDLDGLGAPLAGARHVLVPPMPPFQDYLVMFFLEARGTPFTQVGRVAGNFGWGAVVGSATAPPEADATVAPVPGGLEVRYADGRPPVRLAGSRTPR